MSYSEEPDDHLPPPFLLGPRNFSVVSLMLFVLFLCGVAGVVYPLQPLDPAWQLRLAASTIQVAPLALLGLALLHLVLALDPYDPVLQQRQRLCSRLAMVAALGFLLFLPLQGRAALLQTRSYNSAQATRIRVAERKLAALRQAAGSATSSQQLDSRLRELRGPELDPADVAQPLVALKGQVNDLLDKAEQQIAREGQVAAPVDLWRLLPDLLRNGVACVALAIGFAALAMRRSSEFSVPVQGKGWLAANVAPAEPLTGARIPIASQAEIACDERSTGWDFRSGLDRHTGRRAGRIS